MWVQRSPHSGLALVLLLQPEANRLHVFPILFRADRSTFLSSRRDLNFTARVEVDCRFEFVPRSPSAPRDTSTARSFGRQISLKGSKFDSSRQREIELTRVAFLLRGVCPYDLDHPCASIVYSPSFTARIWTPKCRSPGLHRLSGWC
ncbi:hypothetical protein MPTK1_6g03140 [Marchantia polymorpha subsp. ruderalis]|uniref:Uncharacterized protein n=2 Tax=Marchantia polymorpha TaxID=3197 RepID=A0AAF6BN10_MARPO|nr:hypothetical protein MARPO_0035s0094 [Marchantia polymorpha]BBN13394.1 hypothetical protein Mp_6g03140 [Marchantia polymorpha subsp. ruderalis]|eukprot:PTQ41315.1 hypothetical protein MARPO_0035s0094 [Marchantia polymorpha]